MTSSSDTIEDRPRRPRKAFLVVGLVAAAALAVGLFTGIGTGRSSGGRPQVGDRAPTFSLPRLGGPGTVGTPSSGGGDGRPAILVFFASWCGPCLTEVPAIAAAVQGEVTSGSRLARVAVLGVDTADPGGLAFVRDSGVTFPVGSDDTYDVTEGVYAFTGDPQAVAINGEGRIVAMKSGPLSTSQLQAWQRRLAGA